MNPKRYDLIIFIGRFQPPHQAHILNLAKAIALSEYQLVLIGSCFKPRDSKNPFNFKERAEMLSAALADQYQNANVQRNLIYAPLRDHLYNDQVWAAEVQEKVKEVVNKYDIGNGKSPRIGIIGHFKDESSYYLKMFPQWELVEVPDVTGVDSTRLRHLFFNGKDSWVKSYRKEASHMTYPSVIRFLDDFMTVNSDEYERICRELEHIRLYKNAWSVAPYPPTFVTVDAIVVQSGHILLVKRGAAPGEGLWALPGGFVNQFETLENACIRELREETKLKVPEPVLRGSIMAQHVFDHPLRSTRGRTITHAFFIKLADGELPKVKGGDDARSAKWVPLAEFFDMEEVMFEDHAHIIDFFIR